ncbi:MAG: HDIG domain-containing protein [Actinobacteria bacterium]|nr:HDIG domain-containing protein [Actinomycetota bacterium]
MQIIKRIYATSGRFIDKVNNSSIKNKRISIVIVFTVFMLMLIALEISPFGYRIKEGEPSPRDVIAPKTVQYIDKTKTDEQRQAAAAGVQDVYEYKTDVSKQVTDDIKYFFQKIYDVYPLDLDIAEKVRQVKEKVGDAVDPAIIEAILQLPGETVQNSYAPTVETAKKVMDEQVKPDELEQAKELARIDATEFSKDPAIQVIAGEIASNYIKPNSNFNAEETEKRKTAAREAVSPVITTVLEGETIIGKGQIVSSEQASLLKTLGFRSPVFSGLNILYFGSFILLIIAALAMFISKYRKDIYENPKVLVLLGILLVVYTIFAKIAAIAAGSSSPRYCFIVPTAAIAIITAVLVDRVVAIVMVVLCALLTGAVTGGNFTMVAVALLGGFYPSIAVSRMSTRYELRRASLYTAIWVAFVAFGVSILSQYRQDFLIITGIGFLNGFVSSIVAMGLLPFLETTMKVTTNPWLLEIASPEQELLKELSMKAPGTYSHSVMVANLAEAAAREVGSDPLVARVAAYYHDIGKTKRAQFFIENQPEGSNPHNDISPNLSSLIITSHVKDGIEMLNKHGLPKDIIDVIKQHHGTSIVKYFYEKAMEDNENENVDENRFRYHFEKPRSKTAAILMLADAVEATARTLPSTSASAIEQMVSRIVDDKIDDGQLDECDITFGDISKIKNIFSKILISTYHPRITYPKTPNSQGARK